MFERFRGAGTVLAGSLALLLAACGGGGGGGGSNGGGDGAAKSCSEAFSAEKAAADSGACQPQYNNHCDALDTRSPLNVMNPSPCSKDGVVDSNIIAETFSVDGVSYDMVRPANGGKKGLYVALHWRSGNGATMINNMRLAELAKARDITVVAPDSPYKILLFLLSEWDYADAPAKISAVIADAKSRAGLGNVPVTLAGVSSGAAAANRYFCAGNNGITGLLLVASGKITEAESTACLGAAAAASKAAGAKAADVSPVAVVLVEGSTDPAYEDTVANYGHFRTINGCSGTGTSVVLNDQVDISYSNNCSSGHGAALVSVKDSGHSWPGMDRPLSIGGVPPVSSGGAMSIFGPISTSFDATLQGYDLVRSLD